MPQYLNQLLAEEANALVRENFTGVRTEWWWERRLGGGIAVCQELDPLAMAREISERTGRKPQEVERTVEAELGLEDLDLVVLTFEIPGDATTTEAAEILAARSATPQGLATESYSRVEKALHAG